MPSNVESHFAVNPVNIDMPRSSFKRTHDHKTSWNVGDLVPIYVDEVLPGDTFKMKVGSVVRLSTLIRPPMDNLYMDTYFFYVPYRLLWNHWREFMGENTSSAWIPQVQYTMPQTSAPAGGWAEGTIADYLGVPIGKDGFSISSLPFRAYAKIVEDWFRSEVVDDPVVINDGDSTTVGSNGSNYIYDLEKGGKPFIANKYHDYFTSGLPSPQKGPSVLLPIGDDNMWPVVPGPDRIPIDSLPRGVNGSTFPTMVDKPQSTYWNSLASGGKYQSQVFSRATTNQPLGLTGDANTNPSPIPDVASTSYDTFSNLYARSPGGVAGATISDLRIAFQIQKFYEAEARGGSRYTELIRQFFRVISPDARLQRSEYLGGSRRMINVNQVIQQSATDSVSPQGNLAGISLTTDHINGFNKSFTEHGIIIGLVCCRYDHTYQQGLEKFWSRKTRFDFYWPTFASVSEMPIYNRELYLQGNVTNPNTGKLYDEEVFAYQEPWADYRYKPSRISGMLRSDYAQSLDSWHFGDDYNQLPTLSSGWLKEDKTPIDRTLAVTSAIADQFIGDFYFDLTCIRCMPVYSIPGLIDHH